MKSIVQDAIDEWLIDQDKIRKEKRETPDNPRLYPSELKSCRRKIALRLQGYKPTVEIETKGLVYMRGGVVSENDTALALAHKYSNCTQDNRLESEHWSGYGDFIIGEGEDNPIIIEHKHTGRKNWDTGKLPKAEHVGQLCLYYYLYIEKHGVEPRLLLYYKGWGNYAEYELFIQKERIICIGLVNGLPDAVAIRYNVLKEKTELENLRQRIVDGELVLPDRLKYKNMGCSYNGQPSCPYYHHCYDK